MEDVYRITRADACNKTYHEPRYDMISEVMSEEIHKESKNDKDKYNLSRADTTKKDKERLLKNTKKSNISINEATLSSRSEESTYSMEQTKQLIRGMQLSDTGSDSD